MEIEDLSEIDADKSVDEQLMNEKKQQLHQLAETIMQILMVGALVAMFMGWRMR